MGIGLGGVLDILSGTKKRAPEPIQQAGLEWLWRMLLEPKRIVRNLALLEFALRVQLQSWFDRTSNKGESHDAQAREQRESDTIY